MTITVQLPGAFSALPGAATGVSGGLSRSRRRTRTGVDFSGQLNVASVYIGTTQVKDLRLGYDVASGTFMGSATILLVPRQGAEHHHVDHDRAAELGVRDRMLCPPVRAGRAGHQ